MQSVAFLGLGVMGSGMAGKLLDAGFPLTVWNRTAARTAPFVGRGARAATSPGDAASAADVVVSMLADDPASREAWSGPQGVLGAIRPGALLIESSTLSPGWIEELGRAAAAGGCDFLDAPVTGSKTHAADGKLLFLAGGSAEAFDRARPVFAAMGRDAMHLGPVASGARLKLINNFLCGVQAASLAEAVALIERSGLDRDKALAVLAAGAPGSPLVGAVGPRMAASNYAVNFSLALMHKDLSYAIAEGAAAGVTLKTVVAARDRLKAAIDAGLGEKDFSAVVEVVRAG